MSILRPGDLTDFANASKIVLPFLKEAMGPGIGGTPADARSPQPIGGFGGITPPGESSALARAWAKGEAESTSVPSGVISKPDPSKPAMNINWGNTKLRLPNDGKGNFSLELPPEGGVSGVRDSSFSSSGGTPRT